MTKLEIDKPKFGELTQIASDLYWVHFELPFRLNHVNLFLMDTPKGLLILDAGLKSEHSEEHWEALINGPLKSKKFAGLLITHYHPDHIGMAGWLQKKLDIKCYTTAKELFTANTFRSMPDDEYAKIFRNVFVRAGMSEEDILAKGPATRLYKNRVYELPEFEIIKAGHEIESNDGLWIARTDSGHSPEHISLMDYKRKLYLSGDFLLPRISPNISDNFFDPLDDRLGGLHKSDLVIIAGRPAMGKTALATNIAFNAATNIQKTNRKSCIAFFSLEMSSEQLSTRILAEQSRIKSNDIRRGKIKDRKI